MDDQTVTASSERSRESIHVERSDWLIDCGSAVSSADQEVLWRCQVWWRDELGESQTQGYDHIAAVCKKSRGVGSTRGRVHRGNHRGNGRGRSNGHGRGRGEAMMQTNGEMVAMTSEETCVGKVSEKTINRLKTKEIQTLSGY